MARPSLAVVRIVERTDRRRDPHAAFFVEHRVVNVVLALPDRLAAPVRRWLRHRGGSWRRIRIADRQLDRAGDVLYWIEDRQVVGAELQRAVKGTVRVDRRVAAIRRDDVVQVRLRIDPIPPRDAGVALGARRTGRHRRQLAAADAIGPARELRENPLAAELVQRAGHLRTRLARLNAALPGGHSRRELAELALDLARGFVAELMAGQAAAGFQA